MIPKRSDQTVLGDATTQCIIGSGISALYYAYNLSKRNKQNFIILESSPRIGGRLKTVPFQGMRLPGGAGVGRYPHDKKLMALLKELDVPYTIHKKRIDYALSYTPSPVRSIINVLRKIARNLTPIQRSTTTFKEFAIQHLGSKEYDRFITTLGYTDYEDADIIDTLYEYRLEDNIPSKSHYTIMLDWDDLVDKIYERIGPQRFITGCSAYKIDQANSVVYAVLNRSKRPITIKANNIVIATAVDSLDRLLPKPKSELQRYIGFNSFIRIYARLAPNPRLDSITSYTVVPKPLQKIIPIDKERNIYMIAYSDNQNAERVASMTKSQIAEVLNLILCPPKPIRVLSMKSIYWKTGTHYFKPLPASFKNRKEFIKKIAHPYPNVRIIGEALSKNQGWVEGALRGVVSSMHITDAYKS